MKRWVALAVGFSIALAICTFTLPLPAHAEDEYQACMDTAVTNMDFDKCGSKLLKNEDDKLNQAWAKAYDLMDGQSKTDLLAEQRAWIVFKEKSCQFYTNGEWGHEGEVIHFAGCRAVIIHDRTKQLESIVEMVQPH